MLLSPHLVTLKGMGEPLDNYDAVKLAIKGLIDPSRFGMQAKRVTVSTVGVVPRLISMKSDEILSKVSLALSLHAPDQETRLKIVPTAEKFGIDEVLRASSEVVEAQNGLLRIPDSSNPLGYRVEKTDKTPSDAQFRHLLVEYILIRGVNGSIAHAQKLADLLETLPYPRLSVLTNLIPYNPVESITAIRGFQPPTHEETSAFAAVLKERGLKVLVRQEMGQDVGSACGQLVVEGARKKMKAFQAGVKDIEELGIGGGLKNRKGRAAVVRKKRDPESRESTVDLRDVEDGADEASLLPPEARVKDGMAPLLAAQPKPQPTTSNLITNVLKFLLAWIVIRFVLRVLDKFA